MCLNPIYLKKGYVKDELGQRKLIYYPVPCGKCVECLGQKQQEQAILSMEEFKKFDTFHFFTLTYSNESVPITYYDTYVDTETGEMLVQDYRHKEKHGVRKRTGDLYFIKQGQRKRLGENIQFGSKTGEFFYSETIGEEIIRTYYPSLRREDVKNWLKLCREKWYQEKGERINFSYSGCGEYGSQTFRPHYHFNIFGLTNEQAEFFAQEWRKKYGFTYVASIPKCDSEQAMKTAMYTAKYTFKPEACFGKEFEELFNEQMSERYAKFHCEKPRRQTSKNYGISQDFPKIEKQLVGDINIEDDSDDTAKKLLKRQEKAKYQYNGKEYKIPKKIKDRIFKFNGKNIPVQNKVTDIKVSNYFEDYTREFKHYRDENCKGQDFYMACQEFSLFKAHLLMDRAKNSYNNMFKKYANTKIR